MEMIHQLDHAEMSVPHGNCKFAISPDGKYVASGSTNGMLFLFDLTMGEFVEAYGDQHQESIIGVDWAPGTASTIATIDKTGLIFLWN